MHKLTMDFLQEQYRKTKLLRSSSKGEVWLVTQADDTPAIMRIINHLGVPGDLLRDNPHTLWPRILYFAEDEAPQRTIIVEEYIGGQSMQEYLENSGCLSETEAQKFLLVFCYGLSHLHKLGIVHRDIKPSNIIRQSSGGFKLIDFDVARLRNTKVEDKDTVLLGTRGYAPPEQYGYSQTDRRSDIYSLGVTMEELLGEDYKGYLRPVIRKCRALDPAMRYQSAEEVIRAIKLRRGFIIAMPMVVGILLLLVLTVIWLFSGSKAPDSVGNPLKQLEELIELPSLPDSPEKVESPKMPNSQEQTESPQSPGGLPSDNTNNDTRKAGKDFQGNGISMETVGHGNGLSGGTAGVYYVSPDVYRYWSRENQDKLTGAYSVYLPDDWYIDVVIKNSEWNGPWNHPTFDITYTRRDWDGNNIVSRELRELPDIPSGGEANIRINLGGMKIDNVRNYYGPKIHIQPRWPKNTKSGGWAKQIQLDFLNDNG
ncbi:serine/threonine-protein kinase [Anaerovibrio lipolyticus]|uniref:serine/threonine protein kinase n=1 Tax=Anaerovibrio lipolyticus TaxID=82374 RepID=UPI0023F10DC4|nr:serine/threonine-protein kinase [Anaerovibrio lipolyticus]